jgi:hypothetical protein
LAAAAPQIAGHIMRNVVVGHETLRWVIAGAGAAGRDARLGNEMRGTDRIIRPESGVVLYEDDEARYLLFCRPATCPRQTSENDVNGEGHVAAVRGRRVLGMRSALDWPSPSVCLVAPHAPTARTGSFVNISRL